MQGGLFGEPDHGQFYEGVTGEMCNNLCEVDTLIFGGVFRRYSVSFLVDFGGTFGFRFFLYENNYQRIVIIREY